MTQLATLICVLCIGYLLWIDRKPVQGVSHAVWIPLIWMFLAGSRYASQWLELGAPEGQSAEAYRDGSPLDRNVFLLLIVAGTIVLIRRKLNWSALLSRNSWILLFFLFAAISIVWSDEPFVALKRWFKGMGTLVMALVILTERRPYEALGFVIRRLAFFLLPLSVLFIRYYPELGRTYHMDVPMFSGVAFSKNSLGQLCLIVGIYFLWELLLRKERRRTVSSGLPTTTVTRGAALALPAYVIILLMVAWLLYKANSATSLVLMIFAVGFLLLVRVPLMARKPRRILVLGIGSAVLFALLEFVLNFSDRIIQALGRDPDLTSRTPVWAMVISMVPNHWIGAGYESFWSGQRLTEVWERLGYVTGGIIQAHNGYIETYLNLGVVGVALLSISILAGLIKAERHLQTDYTQAALRIAIILVTVVYNYTEAAFKPLNNLFVLLLFAIVEVKANPRSSYAMTRSRKKAAGSSTSVSSAG